ncbi:MAG TPA: N-acetyl-1-D-myo-inositol-2-amino-2-deoxy-alpha-D-glucopyranoside deacetylase [Candidatus Nanopelagicaceae bacterium]|nr:N-acetyl-1-D-myo-inositol-2-amino-2-deoxy-alpha-D-glucopyranoside deacetylase [Candidatus Nanopelagicaceae bacterium]
MPERSHRPEHRLLLVHAHPDDESINNGATMAKYVSAGVGVTLVTCTRGEEGEVLVSDLTHLASDKEDGLGEHRVVELAAAMKELGVSDHRFLGEPDRRWRDSGMMGTPPNENPSCFWRANVEEAAAELVKVILEIEPQVLITYDEFGGYGHPDHIQAHRVAMRAAEIAEVPDSEGRSWAISKIYWNTMPRSVIAAGMAAMKEAGMDFFGTDNIDDIPFAKPDELVTAVVDANGFVDRKMAALAAHETQITMDGPFFALSNALGQNVWGTEYYSLVRGERSEPFDSNGKETDLFAGV